MRFLYNEAAVLYRRALIVGDTHFGIEQRLRRKGIRAAHVSEQLGGRLLHLARENRAKKIIFLGDVKDDITGVDSFTQKIFAQLKSEFELIIVRGNHDGGIEQLGATVIESVGLRFGSLGLIHGHAWPSDEIFRARYILSAHQHPQLVLRDAFGKPHREPVWAIAPPDRSHIQTRYRTFHPSVHLVVMPAFNPLVGFPISKLSDEHLGPILNNKLFKWDRALVYRLDGSCVGRVTDL